MNRLNKEEKEILDAFKQGKLKSVKNVKKHIALAEEYAKNTFNKNKRINIRISEKDLYGIQKKALQEGIPYQTLIASVIHKYVDGKLTEKPA